MNLKSIMAGHRVHSMLIVFPLGLLLSAWFFDAVAYFTGHRYFYLIAYWNGALGLVSGLVAAVFGLVDWMAIPLNTRAKDVGVWHGGAALVMLTLFGWSWLLRIITEDHAPTLLSFCLATFAVVFAIVTGWLGGELVNRYGVGVQNGAGLDGIKEDKPDLLSAAPAPPADR